MPVQSPPNRRFVSTFIRPLFVALALPLAGHAPCLSAAGEAGELLDRLRAGGHLLFILPTEADTKTSIDVQEPPGCAPGDRLTQRGWQDALTLGTGLYRARVQVEVAVAGPDCTTRHTAYLVFGADRVRRDAQLSASCAADPGERHRRAARLRERLAEPPPYPDVNLAVVGHACNLADVADASWPDCTRALRPGDGVVFATTAGRAEPLGCVPFATFEEWSRRPR